MFKLTQAKEGLPLVLALIEGGHCLANKLTDMGLLPGEKIQVINNSGHGPITVLLKGAKLALGQGIAKSIIVEEERDER